MPDEREMAEVHAYPPYSSGEGACPKCGAPETRSEAVSTREGRQFERTRRYVPAEAERREYKPVFVGGLQPAYTNQPPQQPDRYDEIIHAAKPERIHHTCGICGYTLSTLCKDFTDAR